MRQPSTGGHDAWSSPGFLLWHATLRWQRQAAAVLRPLELTHAQMVLLGSLWWMEDRTGPPSQRELADHAGTDRMMTSQVVRALQRRGLIMRIEDPDDARVWRLRLTGDGRELAERAVKVMDALDDEFFAEINRTTAVRVLRRLAHRDGSGTPT